MLQNQNPIAHSSALHLLWIGFLLTLPFHPPMSASESGLHPLGQSLPRAEIQITLRNAASPGESCAVECVYRPHRERDVQKSRHFGFFSGWIGGSSRELIRVQRTEFHSARQRFTATDSHLSFKVSTHDPDPDFKAYQLDSIRLIGSRTGTLEWERWFPGAPQHLDPGFGLRCDSTTLQGVLRPSALNSQPLRGALPLWPSLRTVDLDFKPVEVPLLQFFEPASKHHWDGWRQKSPDFWPGGQTTLVHHTNNPTVWRDHQYHAFASSQDPLDLQSPPPPDVIPGTHLEIFWPQGDSLEFPETRFDVNPSFLALPVSQLPPRMKELLARSSQQRPGWEPGSLSATEWRELDQLTPVSDLPLSVETVPTSHHGGTLRIVREMGFAAPWILIFGGAYDHHQRYIIKSMIVRPDRWKGPLPD